MVEIDKVVLEISYLYVFWGLLCCITFSWRRVVSFIWINLNPLHPRMLWIKIDWNWSRGSGEMWKQQTQTNKQTNRRTTGDQKSSWTLNSGELKRKGFIVPSWLVKIIYTIATCINAWILYSGIILTVFVGGKRSRIVKILLVLGNAISWVIWFVALQCNKIHYFVKCYW